MTSCHISLVKLKQHLSLFLCLISQRTAQKHATTFNRISLSHFLFSGGFPFFFFSYPPSPLFFYFFLFFNSFHQYHFLELNCTVLRHLWCILLQGFICKEGLRKSQTPQQRTPAPSAPLPHTRAGDAPWINSQRRK